MSPPQLGCQAAPEVESRAGCVLAGTSREQLWQPEGSFDIGRCNSYHETVKKIRGNLSIFESWSVPAGV